MKLSELESTLLAMATFLLLLIGGTGLIGKMLGAM